MGLVWKIQFFWWSDRVYFDYRLRDPFFPDWLESPWTLRIAFVAAVMCGVGAAATTTRLVLTALTGVELVALSVLLVHQGSYNDMTFLTSWWTSLWCLWLCSQLDRNASAITASRGARLASVVLSLIMLGAAAGKWTSEYWSGNVLYEIYFRDRQFWLFDFLRERLGEAELKQFSMVHSRTVIVVETIAGMMLWCIPTRLSGWIGLMLMLLIPITNNWLLFSVTMSLIGLSWAAIRLSPTPTHRTVVSLSERRAS